MSSARRRSASGFSLLDALGATGVVGVALLSLSGGSITLTRNAKAADGLAAAAALAEARLEVLRSLPPGADDLRPGEYEDAVNPRTVDGLPGGRFSRRWSISAGDTPSPGLQTIVVTVAWTDARPHQTRLAAYVRCSAVPCP